MLVWSHLSIFILISSRPMGLNRWRRSSTTAFKLSWAIMAFISGLTLNHEKAKLSTNCRCSRYLSQPNGSRPTRTSKMHSLKTWFGLSRPLLPVTCRTNLWPLSTFMPLWNIFLMLIRLKGRTNTQLCFLMSSGPVIPTPPMPRQIYEPARSLFFPLPKERNCQSLSLHSSYCVCDNQGWSLSACWVCWFLSCRIDIDVRKSTEAYQDVYRQLASIVVYEMNRYAEESIHLFFLISEWFVPTKINVYLYYRWKLRSQYFSESCSLLQSVRSPKRIYQGKK